MEFLHWFCLNLLKTQSMNLIFGLIINLCLLFLELYIISTIKNSTNFYEAKTFLPERHLTKLSTPHWGGLILMSNLWIQWILSGINDHVHSFFFRESNFAIIFSIANEYLLLSLILGLKILFMGIFTNLTHKDETLQGKILMITPWISWILNQIIIYNIISNYTYKLFPIHIKSFFFYSYGPFVYMWPLIINIMPLLMATIGNKFQKNYNEKEKKFYILGMIFFILSNYGIGLWYYYEYIMDFFNPPIKLIILYIQTFLIKLVPIFVSMILGSIDDVYKINKNIINILFPKNFIMFFIAGAIYNFNDIYLLNNIVTILLKKFTLTSNFFVIKYVNLAINSYVFNCLINATNFTDGADGLLYSSTMPIYITIFLYILYKIFILFNKNITSIFLLMDLYSSLTSVFIWILFFSVFFYFNKKPAKLFLGETGSFGAAMVLITMMKSQGIDLMIFLGFIMGFVQLLSTFLQVMYFKRTKKRLFLMAPFHHHLELLGYKDEFILIIYTLINAIGALLGLFLYIKMNPWGLIKFFDGIITKILW